MDFSIPDKTRDLLNTIREFIESEIYPLEELTSSRSFYELLPLLEEKRKMVKKLGLWTPQIPKEYGGVGLGFLEYAMVCEQLARSPYGVFVFNAQAPDAGNMEILIQFGTPEQKERWLHPLLAGEIRSCFSMTEPDRPGSNPTWMETTAVRDGDDYVINGHKWFTTAADGAAFSILMAVTHPDAPPHQRASQIIVPTDTPGFAVTKKLKKLGYRASDTAELAFDNVRVPVSNRIGEEGMGFVYQMEQFQIERIICAISVTAGAEKIVRMTIDYCRGRVVFGKPLIENQWIYFKLSELLTEIEFLRQMCYHCVRKLERLLRQQTG